VTLPVLKVDCTTAWHCLRNGTCACNVSGCAAACYVLEGIFDATLAGQELVGTFLRHTVRLMKK
jgi:hypothetical protein